MSLPAPDVLSLGGIGVVAAFGLWKAMVTPRLQRRAAPMAASSPPPNA